MSRGIVEGSERVETTGYTTGVFDLFHVGHVNLLRRAKLHCDRLIVAVSTDELAADLKGKRPVIPFEERVEIVASIRYVDEVVPEIVDDKMEAWRHLQFDVIFKGDDWKGTEKWNKLEKSFAEVGVRVIYLPYTRETSSTIVREALEAINNARTPDE